MYTLNILSIGGSDPSSGAGIQSDVRVFSELGAHCLSVITAVTSQNTSSYSATHEIPVRTIRDQLDSVMEDFEPDAVKVGMLYGANTMRCVASALGHLDVPVIVDPVMISTTRGVLMRPSAFNTFRSQILPIANVLTPNLAEAESLSGVHRADASAKALIRYGAQSVIITGLNCDKSVCDWVFSPKKTVIKTRTRKLDQNHGGGCAHSAAITFAMAKGNTVISAAKFARKFVESHIINSAHMGRGVAISGVRNMPYIAKLNYSIMSFCALRRAYALIPECQSNFVLAPPGAVSVNDMLGVCGRITRAGTQVVVAGTITRGGSQHVASALTTMREKFQNVSSCMNIKRTPQILAAITKLGFHTCSYDRAHQPASESRREGTTVAWGVRRAISKANMPPDIIHHAGSYGKEPMILVFGNDSNDVLDKVRRIITVIHSI